MSDADPEPEVPAPGGDDGGEAPGEGGGEAPVPYVPKPKDPFLFVPIYVMTGIFAIVFFIVPLFFRKGPNRGIVKFSIMIGAFAMWIFWVTVYIAQINPLVGPRMKNTTLAWIAHSWGLAAKAPEGAVEGGEEGGEKGGEGGGDEGGDVPPEPDA